ncbi:MAG: transporter substrate-binding domain-containing protein, partial [Pseudolabrys sp.]
MPNLDYRQRLWSSPGEGRWTRFVHVASTVCVALALWIGGIIAPSSAMAGTLDDVRARGTLVCGVSEGLPGFSEKDGSGVWRGFDVDFCKAVAAVVFGDITKVEYRPLSAEARFEALKDRRIDLLS